jgi:hypothetical protein
LDNHLTILILAFEEEKSKLEALIKDCLEDFEGPDYRLANHHQRALLQTQQVLRVLYNYEDEFFEEKERLSRNISLLEKQVADRDSPFLEERLKELKIKLEKLKAVPKTNTDASEQNILQTALIDIVNKNVKKFRFILNNAKNLYLEFLTVRKTIKIVLPNINFHIKQNTLYESEITAFLKIGFEWIGRNKLEISFTNEGEITVERIKFLLVKVIFQILYPENYRDESYIEFVD